MATVGDLLASRDLARQRVEDFLGSKLPLLQRAGIDESLGNGARVREDLLGREFSDLLSRTGQKFGLPAVQSSGAASVPEVTRKLKRSEQSQIDSRIFQEARSRINAIYQNALTQRIQAGDDEMSAREYARQTALQDAQNQFEAMQREQQRQSELRAQAVREEFAQKGLALQQEFQPQFDFTNSLVRSLAGLTGAGLTAYFLNRQGQNTGFTPQAYSPLRTGSGFTTATGFPSAFNSGQVPISLRPENRYAEIVRR